MTELRAPVIAPDPLDAWTAGLMAKIRERADEYVAEAPENVRPAVRAHADQLLAQLADAARTSVQTSTMGTVVQLLDGHSLMS